MIRIEMVIQPADTCGLHDDVTFKEIRPATDVKKKYITE